MSEYWKKVLKGLGIAVAGAILAYASSAVIPALNESGNPTLLIVAALASALVNAIQKVILSN